VSVQSVLAMRRSADLARGLAVASLWSWCGTPRMRGRWSEMMLVQLGRAKMSTWVYEEERTHGNDTKRSKLCHAIKPSLAMFRVQHLPPFHPITTFLFGWRAIMGCAAEPLGRSPVCRAEPLFQIKQRPFDSDDGECDKGGQDSDEGSGYPSL
jgi:hypothetical protein